MLRLLSALILLCISVSAPVLAQTEQEALEDVAQFHVMNEVELAEFLQKLNANAAHRKVELEGIDLGGLRIEGDAKAFLKKRLDLDSVEEIRSLAQELLVQHTLYNDILLLLELNALGHSLDVLRIAIGNTKGQREKRELSRITLGDGGFRRGWQVLGNRRESA